MIQDQNAEWAKRGHRDIWLAGGCFWGAEKYFSGVQGVVHTSVGYANGHTPSPAYEQVCTKKTGYAEAVHVVYDPRVISLRFLITLFTRAIDPTTIDRQGGDIGNQYRTGIYYIDEADASAARAVLSALQETLEKPVVVEVRPLLSYYLAEDYHQKYLVKNPAGYCHVSDAMCRAAASAREYEKPDPKTLRARLDDLSYRVTQQNATEPPFENAFDDHFESGIYVDITTGAPLFLSKDKFDSGCGWPAFAAPALPVAVTEHRDATHGMERVEVRSAIGDAHLGHVFPDGSPQRGGLRYCINSAALRFISREAMEREGYGAWVAMLDEDSER